MGIWDNFVDALTRTWNKSTAADGDLFQLEFARLTANDVIAKNNVDVLYGLASSSVINGFLDNSKAQLSVNESTRTLTLSVKPPAVDYTIYSDSIKHVINSDKSAVWTDVEGFHFFYIDSAGVLQTSITTASIPTDYIASLYWDASNHRIVGHVSNEFHNVMDSQTHLLLHESIGSLYISGANISVTANGDGSSNAHCQFSSDAFVVRNQDAVLSGLLRVASDDVKKVYREGTNWREYRESGSLTSFLVQKGTSLRACYNSISGSSGSQIDVTSDNFVLAHLFLVPGLNMSEASWVIVQGLHEYASVSSAKAFVMSERATLFSLGLPIQEYVHAFSVLVQTSSSYTNAVKSRIVEFDSGVSFLDFRMHGRSTSVLSQLIEHDKTSGISGNGAYHVSLDERDGIKKQWDATNQRWLVLREYTFPNGVSSVLFSNLTNYVAACNVNFCSNPATTVKLQFYNTSIGLVDASNAPVQSNGSVKLLYWAT